MQTQNTSQLTHCRVSRPIATPKLPCTTSFQSSPYFRKYFHARPRQIQPTSKLSKNPRTNFFLFIPQFCITADITYNDKTKVLTLAVFISAQTTDATCRSAFASVRKPNTRSNVDSDGLLILASPLVGASQRFLRDSLRPCFLHLCHCSLLACQPGERRMCDSMRKDSY